MKVKFCGIRREIDVEYCNRLMPDYMGMILSSGFRRSISLETAVQLMHQKASGIKAVGVFVNQTPDEIATVARTVGLDIIQLHGNEGSECIATIREKTSLPVWKAIRVQDAAQIDEADALNADCLILEGYKVGAIGGAGVLADWELLAMHQPSTPFFLAGGITPENVVEATETVKPWGIDCSSGIEVDGVKDYERMAKIMRAVRGE